jgi:hypothetical protein
VISIDLYPNFNYNSPLMTRLILFCLLLVSSTPLFAQGNNFKLKYKNSAVYAGIDIGSKGVKLSVLEVSKSQKAGNFNILQESSVNTDFISFTDASFQNTLNGLCKMYTTAAGDYNIPSDKIFTLVSSGVKGQADKEDKNSWVLALIDSFKKRINDQNRQVSIIDVLQEARLSHLGIVPDSKRYNTFLIDIGSGNTKGGYFPNGNTKDFKLFNVNWGTKSIANATDKRCEDDKSINNYSRQLYRVLAGEPNSEIIYAVNSSGAYNMSDNIAVSGGAAWAAATLMYPELVDNSVIPVTYDEVVKFSERLATNYASFSDTAVLRSLNDKSLDKTAIAATVKNVNQVFDQKAMMAGTGLLLKIMRQFEGIYEKKQFYLIKNGQVGWISAYVDQNIAK